MALGKFTLTVIESVEMDFSLWRRRQNLSSSSDNSSPPAPSLQSPAAYHTSIANIAKATLRQRIKSDHFVDMPPMFPEDADYEDDRISCNLRRCAPVEAKPAHVPQTGVLEGDISTRSIISQYFKNAFRPREQQNPPQLQEGPDSVTVFEIKLNTKVCSIPRLRKSDIVWYTYSNFQIRDVESHLSNLSSYLAQIFQRPEHSVMVTIQQDAFIQFGNSTDLAYLMKIFALPDYIAPMTNRRNTTLVQSALQERFYIPPERGVIIYLPVPGENLATNNTTFMDENPLPDQNPGILRTISRSMSRRLKSSSAQSAPLSTATTASWDNPADTQRGLGATVEENVGPGETSNAEENPGRVKKSKSVRRFISRQLADLGNLSDLS